MSWSTDSIILLIEGYESNPCLFNVKHMDYHNKHKRNVALNNLSEMLGKTISDIQKKWNGIRNTYSAERRKVLDSQKSGAGVSEIYVPKLWYHDRLKFLNEYLTTRKPVSSFEINEGASTSNSSQDVDMVYEVGDDGFLSPLPN
uniref:Uncharacterized protein LOC114348529 n=1 Tax=Diabrotica virgifera virgifera TaxID=50390 RepID=A0A6P7HB35_DIAVI